MLIAVTRPVSASLAECALTHLERVAIDLDRARHQHALYEDALRSLGVRVLRAPAADDLPDAVFIEDTALVLDEVAVITRPGAETRRREPAPVSAILSEFRPVQHLQAPATLDGGDVLRVGRTIYVGLSSRTNQDGVEQLTSLVGAFGYRVVSVPVTGCLHLKSAVSQVDERLLLVNPRWVPAEAFGGLEHLEVAEGEAGAANALRVNGAVIYPAHFPSTAHRLAERGLEVVSVPSDELAKAEGGVTCCSLLFPPTGG
jgi:dimethylargininase